MVLYTNKKNSNVFSGLLFLVLGLIIFNNPFGTLEVIASVMAFIILIWGIINLISYKFMNTFNFKQTWLLSQGLLNIIFAIVVFMSLSLAVKTIMFFFGAYLVILSILKIFQGLKLKKYKIVNWEINILLGLIGIIFGVALFILPEIVTILIGLLLITIGTLTIANSLFIK